MYIYIYTYILPPETYLETFCSDLKSKFRIYSDHKSYHLTTVQIKIKILSIA